MSMRRNTGRDRRGQVFPVFSLAPYYASGIKMHWDAALGVTSSASRVSQWDDQTGNGNHMTQATGVNRPLLVTGATPSGRPVIQLDDAARFMQKNGGSTTQANAVSTVFMVVKVPNATAPRIYYHGNAGGTAGFQLTGATNNCTVSVLSSTAITGAAYDLTKFQVIAWRLRASGGYGTAIDTKELYINGVLQAAPTGTPNLTQGTDTLLMGQNTISAAVSYAEMAEAPDTLMSATDVIAISLGLMQKHGVT